MSGSPTSRRSRLAAVALLLLALLGAPWRPGRLFQRGAPVPVPVS